MLVLTEAYFSNLNQAAPSMTWSAILASQNSARASWANTRPIEAVLNFTQHPNLGMLGKLLQTTINFRSESTLTLCTNRASTVAASLGWRYGYAVKPGLSLAQSQLLFRSSASRSAGRSLRSLRPKVQIQPTDILKWKRTWVAAGHPCTLEIWLISLSDSTGLAPPAVYISRHCPQNTHQRGKTSKTNYN